MCGHISNVIGDDLLNIYTQFFRGSLGVSWGTQDKTCVLHLIVLEVHFKTLLSGEVITGPNGDSGGSIFSI